MAWLVQIIDTKTGKVAQSIKCSGEKSAERVEIGVSINLNHDKYHTKIEDTAAKKATK